MPTRVDIRFYEELNDFLPLARRKKTFPHTFFGSPTIKDIIESLGVPHTEVDLILVNSNPVNFDHHPGEGDLISVYPVFESLDISPVTRLRPTPLREARFIADVHLGKLAKYLRMLGFDTLYQNYLDDPEIILISVAEKRIVLTRDKALLKNRLVTHGYFVRSSNPITQLDETVRRFDLKGNIRPFHLCMECNHLIEKVTKEEIRDLLKTRTRKHFDEFYRCSGCGRVYWKGSHYEKMSRVLEKYR